MPEMEVYVRSEITKMTIWKVCGMFCCVISWSVRRGLEVPTLETFSCMHPEYAEINGYVSKTGRVHAH